MNHALRAGGAVAGISLLTAFGAVVTGARAQDAPSCARPNMPAAVLRPGVPDTPAMAQQQGIAGTVQVVVSLDPNSRVVGTRIQSSPSAILNNAALSAARASVFQTEIRNCVPIASDFILNVAFDSVPGIITPAKVDQRPIAVVTGQGVATRPPDVAYVSAGIITNDDDAAAAAAKNDAIYAALRTQVKTLGVDDAALRSTYFAEMFVPRPAPAPSISPNPIQRAPQRYGYVASRTVTTTLADVTKAGAVADAMRSAGATSIGVQFVLRERRAAYSEALAAAVKDAAAQAHVVADASHMHVAGVQTIRVGENQLGPATPPPTFNPPFSQNGPALPYGNLHPAPVEVRATVTVTYVMKP
jgi:TonB family protein